MTRARKEEKQDGQEERQEQKSFDTVAREARAQSRRQILVASKWSRRQGRFVSTNQLL